MTVEWISVVGIVTNLGVGIPLILKLRDSAKAEGRRELRLELVEEDMKNVVKPALGRIERTVGEIKIASERAATALHSQGATLFLQDQDLSAVERDCDRHETDLDTLFEGKEHERSPVVERRQKQRRQAGGRRSTD